MRLNHHPIIAILVTGIVAATVFGLLLSTRLPDALARDEAAARQAGLEQQLTDRRVQAASLEEELQAATRQLSEARALTTKMESSLHKNEKKARGLQDEVAHLRNELAAI